MFRLGRLLINAWPVIRKLGKAYGNIIHPFVILNS